MRASTPVFESARLLFYEFDLTHAPHLFELNSDIEVLRHTGDKPFKNLEDAQIFIANYSPYLKTGMGMWLLTEKPSKHFIGWCGLKQHNNGEVDLGYRILRREWNKGYATEASKTCIKYAFEVLKLKYLVNRVHFQNTTSNHLAQKIGFKFWKHIFENGSKFNVYKLNNPHIQ